MPDSKEILRSRVDERLTAVQKSAHAVSLEIGANPGYVRDLLDPDKTSIPRRDRLQKLAAALKSSPEHLLGEDDGAPTISSEVAFRELPQGWRDRSGDGIPVLGTAYCADLLIEGGSGEMIGIEQIQLEPDHTITHIARPRGLWNALNAYAIYFQGSSMERRFYQGELGVVDPNRPPSPGQVVLVKLNDGDSADVISALVKELVKITSSYVELMQYNPEITFKVPRNRVVAIERVYRPDELLGL